MKGVTLLVVVLAVAAARAQDLYYGVDPAPSMYAAQAGSRMPLVNEQGQPIPAAPSMDAMLAGNQAMAGAPYLGNPQMVNTFQPTAFVEQPQQFASPAAAPFATEEAQTEEADEEDEQADEADTESEESETEAAEESEEEGEQADSADEVRFAERKKGRVGRAAKKVGRKIKKVGRKIKNAFKKAGRKLKKFGKKIAKNLAKLTGIRRNKNGKVVGPNGKPTFKPKLGKPKNGARAPSAKTPKAAGGKKLPPMPAPLPEKFKINCKKNPALCIEAETPAEGEEPGDHSPKAVFKKKMEVIKKSLMINNRNIAQELKWIDQVELIMKQYKIKVKKVKEHVADERKAIKELLRQRRIILNEKKQKELELKLKMATTELAALTDALKQVQKKEKELGNGKGQLGAKIKLLVGDLKKLRTDNEADKAQALKKA